MMNLIRKEKKQSSSIHQKIRKAAFVPIESEKTGTFKYLRPHALIRGILKWFAPCKRYFNIVIQKPKLWIAEIDFEKLRNDSFMWLLEVTVEGASANFATHYLFGLPFNPATILAHGIFIKQGLSIYSRIKTNGTSPTIPKKNQ